LRTGIITVAGKEAMRIGPAAFSAAASDSYKNMRDEEKKQLEDSMVKEREKTMTIRDIKKEGSKLFQKIELQVCTYFAILLVCLLHVCL